MLRASFRAGTTRLTRVVSFSTGTIGAIEERYRRTGYQP